MRIIEIRGYFCRAEIKSGLERKIRRSFEVILKLGGSIESGNDAERNRVSRDGFPSSLIEKMAERQPWKEGCIGSHSWLLINPNRTIESSATCNLLTSFLLERIIIAGSRRSLWSFIREEIPFDANLHYLFKIRYFALAILKFYKSQSVILNKTPFWEKLLPKGKGFQLAEQGTRKLPLIS